MFQKDAYKNVLMIGGGRSGVGAVHLLHQLDAGTGEVHVILLEQNAQQTEDKVRESLMPEDKAFPEVIIGDFPEEKAKDLTMVVLSPAVPTDSPLAAQLRDAGLPILSEIELAWQFEKGRVLAITGTNGKTTTTTLVGEIMKAVNGAVHVVGNIGNAYAREAMETAEDSVSVAEISSFQLECVHDFKPVVSAILNITPDHLNRHYTMENYAAIKEKIAMNQDSSDTIVLNYCDEWLRPFGTELMQKENAPQVVWFSSGEKPENGLWLSGSDIVRVRDGAQERLMDVHDMHLVGVCNAENVMAAIAMTEAAGVPMETILQVVRDFPPVEHRIEFVREVDGVRYYNDSKATNPDAAIQGIRAMDRPTVLIGGGYDKKNTYDEWIEAFDGKVKELVLIGQTAQDIAECARKHGVENISFADTFHECLDHCREAAEPGDAVLLSPACASWGMFPDYEERGRQFKEYVKTL